MTNLLLALPFEVSIESLGAAYWDVVEAAKFPRTQLRFRNNVVLHQLGMNAQQVSDADLEEAFGRFEGRVPFLALRYHGYQFGNYNPQLGDGRGFLYGQLRDRHGDLQDLGTKGSGTTPWSRAGDGRLTLKGGVREVIASEALHALGVTTSRTLSLIETGEDLYRSDEPSPTRSAVMVRIARTHLRFGTCERLLYLRDARGLERLLRHVVAVYYPVIAADHPAVDGDRGAMQRQLLAFYGELVEQVARLAAEWMAAGFVHGVLNTDNMSLVGESFDYGPFAFLDRWDPSFTAAYFDQTGLYAYGRQPAICRKNLQMLQEPLALLLSREAMEERLDRFAEIYSQHYCARMRRRLGLPDAGDDAVVRHTLALLAAWPVGYGDFFASLCRSVVEHGLPEEAEALKPFVLDAPEPPRDVWQSWRDVWWIEQRSAADVMQRLQRWNLLCPPTRPLIETLWEAIDQHDDWAPYGAWLDTVMGRGG